MLINRSIRFFAIIALLAVAIVVGLYFFKQKFLKSNPLLPVNQATQPKNTSNKGSLGQSLRDSAGLPVSPATSSGQAVEEYVKTVKQDAKESADLTITDCKANPGVIKVKKGSTITIKNNDSQEIRLRITINALPKVEAKKSIPFTVNVEPAIYGYGCDHTGGDSVAKAGVLNVE